MAFARIVCAILGFSASFLLRCPGVIEQTQRRRIAAEKLRIVSEALEMAEERVATLQERHDRILSQICSFYLSHPDLEDALSAARVHVNEAAEFAAGLRSLQMNFIGSYPNADL